MALHEVMSREHRPQSVEAAERDEALWVGAGQGRRASPQKKNCLRDREKRAIESSETDILADQFWL